LLNWVGLAQKSEVPGAASFALTSRVIARMPAGATSPPSLRSRHVTLTRSLVGVSIITPVSMLPAAISPGVPGSKVLADGFWSETFAAVKSPTERVELNLVPKCPEVQSCVAFT
jgi:hypothetical protein